MRTTFHRTIGLAVAALALATTAQAQGKSHGKSHGQATAQRDRDQRDEAHRGDRSDIYDGRGKSDGVPPGLAKKPGHMPPGQYKKRYDTRQGASVLEDIMRQRGYTVMRIVPTGSTQNVYYRNGSGAEQLAIVGLGSDRLSFRNVPAALLQEVLARLY